MCAEGKIGGGKDYYDWTVPEGDLGVDLSPSASMNFSNGSETSSIPLVATLVSPCSLVTTAALYFVTYFSKNPSRIFIYQTDYFGPRPLRNWGRWWDPALRSTYPLSQPRALNSLYFNPCMSRVDQREPWGTPNPHPGTLEPLHSWFYSST